jgi:hypothetical protein
VPLPSAPHPSAPSCATDERHRLLRAFAVLLDHGVAAHPGVDADPDTARELLRSAILAEFPDALVSYVFWTAADDAAFAADGSLRRPLVLHHSGEEAARSLHAALRAHGLRAGDGDAPGTLRLDPVGDASRSAGRGCRAVVRS